MTDKTKQTTSGSYQNGKWVPSIQGRDLNQGLLDKEKFQDTSPLAAAARAEAERKKAKKLQQAAMTKS